MRGYHSIHKFHCGMMDVVEFRPTRFYAWLPQSSLFYSEPHSLLRSADLVMFPVRGILQDRVGPQSCLSSRPDYDSTMRKSRRQISYPGEVVPRCILDSRMHNFIQINGPYPLIGLRRGLYTRFCTSTRDDPRAL